jgi:hypothetical protein
MLVKDLMEVLQGLDPDTQIILQKDSEGNGYSPLWCHGMGYYIADSTWSGDVYDEDWLPEDCCMDQDEWEEMHKENPLVLILAPVN